MPKKANFSKKVRLGFGVSTKRFSLRGLHPQLKKNETDNCLGPGQYTVLHHDCPYKAKSASWSTKLASEEFSAFLGYHNPELLQERLFQRRQGGPGSYDIFDPNAQPTDFSLHPNRAFGLEERFKCFIKYDQPPPGTYVIKSPRTNFTQVPMMEFDGFVPRFRNMEPSYRLTPNRYQLVDKPIFEKKVSKRGPYDTFTGPRDATTIKNHFSPAAFKPPDKFFVVPSEMDHLLHHSTKSRCGRFLQAIRFPNNATIRATKSGFTMYQRDLNYPSPDCYDLTEHKIERKNLWPFNSSKVNARPLPDWRIQPGSDRYQPMRAKCHGKSSKGSWMFTSKAPRKFFTEPEVYTNFNF